MIDLKKVSLTFGIAVLFVLFIVFLIDAIYESPKHEDYCDYYSRPHPAFEKYPPPTCGQMNQTSMEKQEQCYRDKGEARPIFNDTGCQIDIECDYCSKEFNKVREKYNINIFIISAILGIIAIILGMYLPLTYEAIASGFMFGGILTVAQGTFRAFGDFSKITKVIVLGVELVILIWIGIKKVSDKKNAK